MTVGGQADFFSRCKVVSAGNTVLVCWFEFFFLNFFFEFFFLFSFWSLRRTFDENLLDALDFAGMRVTPTQRFATDG